MTKAQLAQRGIDAVGEFCELNNMVIPQVYDYLPGWLICRACGLYDNKRIYVDARRCASPGYTGAAWSWPGYIIDRTPYGVHCHELGHYVDDLFTHILRINGHDLNFSQMVRGDSGSEQKLTNYCPDSAEWFAEMFRLFVTNPDLMRLVRPKTYAQLILHGLKPYEQRDWRSILRGCPTRTLDMAKRRIEEVQG